MPSVILNVTALHHPSLINKCLLYFKIKNNCIKLPCFLIQYFQHGGDRSTFT